jgi:hypothetical protein
VKPRRIDSNDFVTLEGEDYNLLRLGESLAREEFGRSENRKRRQLHLKALFPKMGDLSVALVPAEQSMPRVIL